MIIETDYDAIDPLAGEARKPDDRRLRVMIGKIKMNNNFALVD